LTKVDVFEISSTTNKTNFHEWGAASPGNFIVGFIRVHSFYSWFKCSTAVVESEFLGVFFKP